MLEGILGKKVGMTHIYSEGHEIPVTVIKAGKCFVTQRKSADKDGYDAVQLGFEEKKPARTTRPMKGHFEKAGTACFYYLAEFGGEELENYEPGKEISCEDIFKVGDFVDISGTSKGKGFQGVVKRWKFRGGPASHGSMHGRAPGSIGQSSDPSRVFKGMKMAGQMGNRKATVQNLKVVGINKEDNIMLVKGSVPGPAGCFMVIKRSIKKR
jgi:large subunit ribosomal protein L3